MAAGENKAVITSFVKDVINQGQLERVDDLVAVDFVELDPLPGQQQGRESLKQVIAASRTAFPDIHWVIEEMVWEGECRFTWHDTHRGEFFGMPATGKQITVKGMVVDRVVAGKMADSRILMGWPEHDETARCHSRLECDQLARREVVPWCLLLHDSSRSAEQQTRRIFYIGVLGWW